MCRLYIQKLMIEQPQVVHNDNEQQLICAKNDH